VGMFSLYGMSRSPPLSGHCNLHSVLHAVYERGIATCMAAQQLQDPLQQARAGKKVGICSFAVRGKAWGISGQPSYTSTSRSLSRFCMMVGAAFRCRQSSLCICRFGCVVQSPTYTTLHHAYRTNQRLHDQTFADERLQTSCDADHLTILASL
jgi:hypothetical protein